MRGAFVALTVLLPLPLFINWRLGLPLIILVAIFGVIIIFVVRRTHTLQDTGRGFQCQSVRACLGCAWQYRRVQSFTRIESEASATK